MDVIVRRFRHWSVWLTIVGVAAGGALAPAGHPAPDQSPAAAGMRAAGALAADKSCELAARLSHRSPASRHAGSGQEVAERDAPHLLLALASPWRLFSGIRLKANDSPVLEQPQADRHVLLALQRSSATSRTSALPQLRSTQLRI